MATADIPVAFRATNQQNQGRPKIGFEVDVQWKSSDGGGYITDYPHCRVDTLFNTYVREHVTYPGGDPFRAPKPFDDTPRGNPFIHPGDGVEAWRGTNTDRHAWGLRTDLREGQFTVTQRFQHQWRVEDADRTVFTPWAFVPNAPLDEEHNPPPETIAIFRHVRRVPDRGNDYCFLTRLTQAFAGALQYDPKVE